VAECGTHRNYCDGCRCDPCKAANATYSRERRKIRQASIVGDEDWHGTVGGYTNHNCRCEACRFAIAGYGKEWWAANPDKALAYGASYRAQHPDKVRESVRKWSRANRDKCRQHENVRRARKAAVVTIPFTAEQLAQKWAYYGDRCYLCGEPADATDHVKPIAKGGPHMLANLKPICTPCNSRKRDRWPYMLKVSSG
jgi:hypothetical protein